MKFSEKLMNLRKKQGISQEELAGKLNVTRQTISKWELDQTVPDMNKLIEISKLFEISLDELINDVETTDSKDTYKESAVEKNNKKISIYIVVIGLIISCLLCGIGFIRQKKAVKTDEQAYNDAYALSQAKVDNAQNRLNQIVSEINRLEEKISTTETELNNMRTDLDKIFVNDRKFSDRYYDKKNEINEKQAELTNLKQQYSSLENEGNMIQNGNYRVTYNLVEPITYLIFYYIAAGIFTLAVIIALIYFLITRRKK